MFRRRFYTADVFQVLSRHLTVRLLAELASLWPKFCHAKPSKNVLYFSFVSALRRLWGAKKDPKPEMEDMLAEHTSLKGVKIQRLIDLFLDVNVRWQLLTIIVTFVTLQLCGINAVSLIELPHMP